MTRQHFSHLISALIDHPMQTLHHRACTLRCHGQARLPFDDETLALIAKLDANQDIAMLNIATSVGAEYLDSVLVRCATPLITKRAGAVGLGRLEGDK